VYNCNEVHEIGLTSQIHNKTQF